ncbi:TetR/AcrR family transcriptional regulator [Sedimentitalea sp.]|uniref:TetR/AcrR family transcriptional regulator n=1 Tax=Sedimentitalea sp. TaxID=2048915 RepID=UPI003299FC79
MGRTKTTRNAELSRRNILASATGEFSSKGFDGARVEVIAKIAGVNINLVYHYFGNKEALFIAVMEEAYLTIRTRQSDMTLRDRDPVDAMTELVRATFRLFSENQHIIGLLSSENMHRACHVRRSEQIKSLYNPLVDFISDTLKRGEKAGVFRSGVDPVELFISISAESYFYLSNQHTLSFILHFDLTSRSSLAAREAHVIDVILSFLRYRGPN